MGDDRAPADILVTTPNIHIRGMDRNTVMIDGTKPGSPECSSAEADQTFGAPQEGAYQGNNGVVVTEYIPHDTSSNVRSLQGKVDQCNVWVRVASEDDPKITSIIVEARTKWGNSNIDLAHQLEKEIALQLSR